ncbi:MAG TPA: OmpA family protein [Xanthobacteraceae bacterium]|jgi:outer membrane protein OmpA-like peptidoglycan-associated protein
MSGYKLGVGILAAAFAGMLTAEAVQAQQKAPDATQIIDQLKSKAPARGLTRNMTIDQGPPPKDRVLIDTLRKRTTRAITIEERDQVAEIVKDKPQIEFGKEAITFDYNSANITPKSIPVLENLGKALTSPELRGTVFVLGGHTDAAGSEAFNQELSEKRAEAVKRFLSEKFKLPAESLVAVGFGKSKLKNPGNPLGEENRRVQVVNTEQK